MSGFLFGGCRRSMALPVLQELPARRGTPIRFKAQGVSLTATPCDQALNVQPHPDRCFLGARGCLSRCIQSSSPECLSWTGGVSSAVCAWRACDGGRDPELAEKAKSHLGGSLQENQKFPVQTECDSPGGQLSVKPQPAKPSE